MNKYTKIIPLLSLSVILSTSLVACSNKDNTPEKNPPQIEHNQTNNKEETNSQETNNPTNQQENNAEGKVDETPTAETNPSLNNNDLFIQPQIDLEITKEVLKNHDVTSDAQKTLTSLLTAITESNTNIAQAYLLDVEIQENTVTIIGASEQLSKQNIIPGKKIDKPTEFMNSANELLRKRQKVETVSYKDAYGTWNSYLQPIFNEKGEVIAIFGIDTSV